MSKFFVAWVGDNAMGAGRSPARAAFSALRAVGGLYRGGHVGVERKPPKVMGFPVTPATRRAHDAVLECWSAIERGEDDFPCAWVAVHSDGVADVVELEVIEPGAVS